MPEFIYCLREEERRHSEGSRVTEKARFLDIHRSKRTLTDFTENGQEIYHFDSCTCFHMARYTPLPKKRLFPEKNKSEEMGWGFLLRNGA